MRKTLAILLLMSLTTAKIAKADVADTQCIKPIVQTIIGCYFTGMGSILLLMAAAGNGGDKNTSWDLGEFFLVGGIGGSLTGGIMLSVAIRKWHLYARCIDKNKHGNCFSPGVTVSIDF